MASSLEDLLAEDGFRGRKSLTRSRTSFRSEAQTFPRYPFPDKHRKEFTARDRIRTERSRSDVSWYKLRSESPIDDIRGSRARDNLVRREKIDGRLSKNEVKDRLGGRNSASLQEGKNDDSLSEKSSRNEIIEVAEEENARYKEIYTNEVYSPQRGEDKYSSNGPKERSLKDAKEDKRNGSSCKKYMFGGRLSSSEKNRRSTKQNRTASERSNRDASNSKSFEDNRGQKNDDNRQGISEPALDEVAIQATVSILSGYIKRFLKDEDFRISLRHNCFSSLNFIELEDRHTESKIIMNLEQAIETVEKVAEEGSKNPKDLKKATLQLSVIAGLNSDELKDGFTSGVPNYKLAACSHLYLSVVYKLQKKDKVSAKQLLQVFCDSPYQARTTLLPDLWEQLFFPQLSHLNVWYNQEADCIAGTPSRPRKLKLLEKLYNEIMDSGTYQFAAYYKDWLTEGVETPSIPSICIPSGATEEVPHGSSSGHSSSPDGTFSMQTMVSKKLYDDVFGDQSISGFNGAKDVREAENFDDSIRSSQGSVVIKQTSTHSSEAANNTDQDIEEDSTKSAPDDAFCTENGHLMTSDKRWSYVEGVSPEKDLNEKCGNSIPYEETLGNDQSLYSPPHTKENELTLKRLAKSVFELQRPASTVDLTVSTLSNSSEATMSHSLESATKVMSSLEELHEGYFGERSSSSSIPQEFICPLTGQLFEDPVTLETGQTFERKAIKEWFAQGNRTCPATGKHLEYLAVPFTNLVLKRVIDSWKSEHCRHLLTFASQIIGNMGGDGPKHSDETAIVMFEQLLSACSREERTTNAKHLISLGGLQFLLQRFENGSLEDKTRVLALLTCCIEADPGCRNKVARDINKQCLLQLLHSKQIRSRTNVVLLLTELVCLKRKKDLTLFLSGLQNEGIENTMHILLVYLQGSPAAERPLVAALLLYLDLLVEPRKYSKYREEAVDAITEALDGSLADEKVRENCCRALFILGGSFSFSGELLKDIWNLKQAGFYDYDKVTLSLHNEEDSILGDDASSVDDEEHANKEWLRSLSSSLLGNGKRSFLETISKCLGSGNMDLVRACLTTVAWLSSALASLSDAEFQLSAAFSALISQLKQSLENSRQLEHKILASMSLFNLSKISECRVLITTMAEDIAGPLKSLAEITWTAKLLYAIISG
ncbi:putative E3 ubiquitin-protein ligase LIN-1 [Ziziphus jujuba]|uniref:RING-type E3 ubiquitin transferase n=1 Tax=Ziziphus jujuba TaxID=326968 RepID=A0ABM3I9V5_ZIZJJ|nr:putative E3 ubiquitin-protein ligase LIN-1 [Ziziphus jujuba]